MKRIVFTLSNALVYSILCFSCVHSPEKSPSPSTQSPANLTYSSTLLHVTKGKAATSVLPTITGTQPIHYTLTTSPSNNGAITISNTGVINVDSTALVGTYQVSVKASNTAGTTTFNNAYQIVVDATPIPPSSLIYTSDTLTIEQGNPSILSSMPLVVGSGPLHYTLSSSASLIAINDSTGSIKVNTGLTIGTYPVTVTATNSAGAKTFTNALVVVVVSPGSPSLFSYSPNTLSTPDDVNALSVAPSIVGDAPLSYSITCTPANPSITINNNTGVLSVTSPAPMGTYAVIVKAMNTIGSTTTTYTVNITPSFNLDILPIMTTYCTSCHNGSIQRTNFNTYSVVQLYAASILSRVELPLNTSKFMPPGGPVLSAAEIDAIRKWQLNGMTQ